MKPGLVYLDHAASTPLDPSVLAAMLPYLESEFGNPSSLYSLGRTARAAREDARERCARLLGCSPHEIVFTSGGTEADNLAIRGVAGASLKRGNHLVTTAVEHHAVLHTMQSLASAGWELTVLPPDSTGRVSVEQVEQALRPATVLVSVMHGNNEVGSLQPVEEIGRLLRDRGIPFHTDAVQTAGLLPLNVRTLPCDLLSLSGHKLYGPKGIGLLYRRLGVPLTGVTTGGDQEFGLRAGTENVAGAVGLAEALSLCARLRAEGEAERLQGLRDRLVVGILQSVPDSLLTGHPTSRLPNHASFLFPGIEGESLLLQLDMRGICASSGAACASGDIDPSHVLLAMGIGVSAARGSLRITLGRSTTQAEIDRTLAVLPPVVAELRRLGAPAF